MAKRASAPSSKLTLGTVGHFGIAVRNPRKSANFWTKVLNLSEQFSFPGGVVVGNAFVDIVLHAGAPHPETIDHVSFHVRDMRTLRAALVELRRKGVDIEDPGNEIGPEGPGSKNMGLWFHDPDGYRWELSVLAPSPMSKRKRHRNQKKH